MMKFEQAPGSKRPEMNILTLREVDGAKTRAEVVG